MKNKRIKRLELFSLVIIGILATVTVKAKQEGFVLTVPARQNWVYTSSGNGDGVISSNKASSGMVYVTSSEKSGITFYAGGYKDGKYKYSSNGTVFTKPASDGDDGWDLTVKYAQSFTKNTSMRLKVRRHTWTLSGGGIISGVVQYN